MSRSRWMLLAAGVSFVAASFAVLVALVWRWVDCNNESDSACSRAGDYQLYAALLGLVPVTIMLVESFRRRGRPLLWLLVAVAVYGAWAILADRMIHG